MHPCSPVKEQSTIVSIITVVILITITINVIAYYYHRHYNYCYYHYQYHCHCYYSYHYYHSAIITIIFAVIPFLAIAPSLVRSLVASYQCL